MVTGFVLTFDSREKAIDSFEKLRSGRGRPPSVEILIGKCFKEEINGWKIVQPFWIGLVCNIEFEMNALDSWLVQFAGIADDIYVGTERVLEFIEYTRPIELMKAKPVEIEWTDDDCR